MIRMTLGALALAFAVAVPATSRAQQASTDTTPTPTVKPHRHHRFAHALFKDVNVTNDERGQMKAIHQKYAPQIKAAHESGDKSTLRTLRTQELDEMRGVLTPDQQTKFDANRAALRARMKHRSTPTPSSPAAPPSGL